MATIKSIPGVQHWRARCDGSNKKLRISHDDDLYNRHPIEEAESLQWMESYMAENGTTFGESMNLFNEISESGEVRLCPFSPNLVSHRSRNS